MAVVGIDFGSLHSKIGVARHRGIDIIANEVSNRATPSLVAFGPKRRAIGEAAKTQETSNFKNTIGSLKRLIGRTVDEQEIQEIEKKFINAKLVDAGRTVGAELSYLGEKHVFSATQLVGSFLGKLRDIAAKELKTGVSDVVIAVPGWFTDVQRRALLDAAAIANLNCLRLVNDSTAIALGYGITKSDLPEPENPRNVAFVDVGHSSMSVSIVAFSKGRLDVKSTAYGRNLGGRDIDYALLTHFATEFKTKYGIDVMSSPKAVFRLGAGCEKLKKILSANTDAPLSVESIMNDIDASSRLTREQLEVLIADVLDRIEPVVKTAIADSGLTLDQIDSVELVGGTTRVPSVRQRLQQAFQGKTLSLTLNQDEAVARGATFSCAMLSPIFRVREFHIHDITPYPIKVQWAPIESDPDDDTELTVFPKANGIPSTKVLSFYRRQPFEVDAVYAQPELIPTGSDPNIAKFIAKELPVDPKGDPTIVKVKTRLNTHNILTFESAYVEEIEEREETAAMDVDQAADPAPADGSATTEGDTATSPSPQPKKKKIVRKKDILFEALYKSLDKKQLEEFREKEEEMHANDKLVQDTEDRKNALEEYVYDMRGKLDDRYATFVRSSDKDKLLSALAEAEDWLYTEEGEDATKSAYTTRLDSLKALGDPITFRYREHEDRPKSISGLREVLNRYLSDVTSPESAEKYSHIDDKDKQSVVEKVATVQKWLEDMVAKQAERKKSDDPVLTSKDMEKKKDEVVYFATPILSRPKPKPPVSSTAGSGTQTPKSEGGKGQQQPQEENKETKEDGPSEMDVD
ncbi:Heat shock protein 70 family [Amanita muscaria]